MKDSPWSRPEHADLILGRARFVGDVDRPNQLALTVVRSSVAHGTIRSVDVQQARREPGVHAVLTAADLPRPLHLPLRTDAHPEYRPFLEPVLATDKVRYVGQPVAIVIADTRHTAEDAAELVEIDVESARSTTVAWQPGSEPLWDGTPDNIISDRIVQQGSVEDAFATADEIVRGDFRIGRDSGTPMETRGIVAEWSNDGTLHLWGPTKVLRFECTTLAGFFGISPDRVVCHHVAVGGMFGSRGEFYAEDFLVPWAAAVTKRPVKWIEDRYEHFVSTNHSREQRHSLEAAVRRDGTLIALRADIWIDMGAYVHPIGWRVPEGTLEHLPGPYRWDALSVRCRAACTNKTPTGTMRGPTNYETSFARERLMDMIADRLGQDPTDIRRKNLISGAEMPYTQRLGPDLEPVKYDSGDYIRIYQGLLRRTGIERAKAEVRERRAAGELVGVGTACFLGHSGLGPTEEVWLEISADGYLDVGTNACEIGQNLTSMIIAVAHRGLGSTELPIRVLTGDTRGSTEGRGTFSSRTTMMVGSAVLDGCTTLRSMIEAKVTDTLGHPGSGLVLTRDGAVSQGRTVSWADLAPLRTAGHHKMSAPTYGFGAHVAQVSVDKATADIRIERIAVAFDCGTIIDPEGVRSQLEGATAQGLSGALFSALEFNDDGQPQTTSFMDYLLPTSSEMPAIEVYPYELPGTEGNPLNAKGVGEAGIIGVGAAVANAVSAALSNVGAVTSLPVTPTTILPFLPALLESGLDAAAAEVGVPQPTVAAPSRRIRGPLVGLLVVLGAAILRRRVERRRTRRVGNTERGDGAGCDRG